MRLGLPRRSMIGLATSVALLIGCSVGVVELCACGEPGCARSECASEDGAMVVADAGGASDASSSDALLRPDIASDTPMLADAPVMDASVMDAPVMDAPVMDVPVVDIPVVDVPMVDVPMVDVPVVDIPVVDARVVDAPVTDVGTAAPPEISLLGNNDLDFWCLPRITNADPSQTLRMTVVVSGVGRFFSSGGNHLVFAVNTEGGAGGSDPHCGPIIRRGTNLFTNARGFIFFAGDNDVRAEHWNGTSSPGVAEVRNGASVVFRPSVEDTLHIRITVGYRTGVLANTMRIDIRRGDNLGGELLFSGIQEGWGWNWSGEHRACIGAIAGGFRSPNETRCAEELVSRSAPSARLPIVSAQLQTF